MPKLEKLSYYVNPQVAIVPGSKSTGAVTAVAVDANSFDRVQYVISVGAIGAGGVFDASVTEGTTASATYTAIATSGMVAITAADANALIIIDVPVSSGSPFQKLLSTVATAAIGICAVANCYNGTRPLGTALGDVTEEVYKA